jgi:hypothetical protein
MQHIAKGLLVVLLTVGCYNARINTGLAPSTQTLEEKWAPSWIFGGVSPPLLEAASQCPNGVSMVHTRHSFLNMLVATLTAGIYTPIHIIVTCAQGGSMSSGELDVPEISLDSGATPQQQEQAFREAVEISLKTGSGVLVRF